MDHSQNLSPRAQRDLFRGLLCGRQPAREDRQRKLYARRRWAVDAGQEGAEAARPAPLQMIYATAASRPFGGRFPAALRLFARRASLGPADGCHLAVVSTSAEELICAVGLEP